jgi:hypothetical protein
MVPGFKPQWTARKGAQELHDSYRSVGLKAEDVKRFTRITHIQDLMKSGQLDASLRWSRQRIEAAVEV